MINRSIKRFENVEFIIPLNNTALRINFQDIPQLRSDTGKEILIRTIRVYSKEECPASFNQNPLVTQADLAKCFLTLYVDSEESIFRIPLLSMLATSWSAGSGQATNLAWSNGEMQFLNLSVDWTKSYVTLSSVLTVTTLQSILFGVGYLRCAPGTLAKMALQEQNAAANGLLNYNG